MLDTAPTTQAPRLSLLHGLGRAAYRAGTTAAGSVTYAQQWTTVDGPADRIAVMAGWRMESDAAMEEIRIGRGTLTTCWDSYTRNGRVTTEKLWLYLPDDGERRFLGLVSEMTQDEASRMAMEAA